MDSRKIKRALQEGNLKYRIVTEILKLFGYSNRNIAGLEIKNKVYQYLERNYGRKIGDFLYEKAEEYDASGDKYIWMPTRISASGRFTVTIQNGCDRSGVLGTAVAG